MGTKLDLEENQEKLKNTTTGNPHYRPYKLTYKQSQTLMEGLQNVYRLVSFFSMSNLTDLYTS